MGLISYYLASKAHDRAADLEEWVDYLENRIKKLEDEMDKLLKWVNYVDHELDQKE